MTDTNTIILARGNTRDERDQSIDTICRWIEDLPANTIDTDTARNMHEWTEEYAATAVDWPDDDTAYLYVQTSTATAHDRQGPDDPAKTAINHAKGDTPTNLIVDTLADIDVDDVVTLVTEHRVRVHDCTHSLTINPTRRDRDDLPVALRRAVEVLAGTAAHADALLAGVEWQGGRPPLGCTSESGRLAPGDDYDIVCSTLQRVERDEWSKTKAAERLGCARKTIDNALERPELYRLD